MQTNIYTMHTNIFQHNFVALSELVIHRPRTRGFTPLLVCLSPLGLTKHEVGISFWKLATILLMIKYDRLH